MVSNDWVQEHIATRVARGAEWRGLGLEFHRKLAGQSRYIRIQGKGFRPVCIDSINPCGSLYEEDGRTIRGGMTIAKAVEAAERASNHFREPGNKKPEQKMQAALIRGALANELQFGYLLKDLGMIKELIFVTDELSVISGEKVNNCRADMVALGREVEGRRFFSVFIELKAERLLSKLKAQLDCASRLLWTNELARDPFRRFLSAVSGLELESIESSPNLAKKMLIWPKSRSGKEDSSVKDAREAGFLVVEFAP